MCVHVYGQTVRQPTQDVHISRHVVHRCRFDVYLLGCIIYMSNLLFARLYMSDYLDNLCVMYTASFSCPDNLPSYLNSPFISPSNSLSSVRT